MRICDISVKNRISVAVLSVILSVLGVYCYITLPREKFPDVTIPFVFISTNHKGVSASDVETSITIPIEKKLKGLDSVKNISSVSSEGNSQINIEFIPGTKIDDVLQKVKDKVDEAKGDLPKDLQNDPAVYEVNFSELPIVVLSVWGPCGLKCLTDVAEDFKDEVETIPGILEVEVTGGLTREIRIEVDPDKLSYYNIPITALQGVVSTENQNTSGGAIRLGDGRYQLRVPGEFERPEEVLTLVVASFNGKPVYLKDVAQVIDGYKEEDARSRFNGHRSVSIIVKKRTGENVIAITEEIDALIKAQKDKWPKGTRITKLMDQAKDIRFMVSELENTFYTALVLVIVVLFFSLGLRNAILVCFSVPFSLFLSFIIFNAMGVTLNMIVLFALTLALGLLVDDAIVIIENIYRYMSQGVPRLEAVMKGTDEVAYPVIGSTATTVVGFLPLIFWPGIMGEFMKYLPITLVITLSSSLLVGVVINTAYAAFFMKVKGKTRLTDTHMTLEEIEEAGHRPAEIKGPILKVYVKTLRYALSHRFSVIVMSFLFLIIIFEIWVYVVGLEKPVEFFPPIDPDHLYVNIDPPEGADLDYIDKIVKKIEIAIASGDRNVTDQSSQIDAYYQSAYETKTHETLQGETISGPSDLGNIEHIFGRSIKMSGGFQLDDRIAYNHVGVQFIDREYRKTPSPATVSEIRERVKLIPGARITVAQEEGGPSTGAPINIEISGEDFKVLGAAAKQICSVVSQVPFVQDVRDDYIEGMPSIRVQIDRQKAAIFGLSTASIGYALKTAYNGMDISSFYEGDEDFDITVKFSEDNRKVTDALYKLMIPSPSGKLVPLSALAQIDYAGSIGDIVRMNHKRTVTVKANVDENKIPGAVAKKQAEERLKDISMPSGYSYKFTGQDEIQRESSAFLKKAMIIALFLIFLVMVTQFNSISQPLIIMVSVLLSFGGAFLGLAIIGSPFGTILSGVGIISLAGIVVKNGIVLVDYTNKLRERGMALNDAIVYGGATRLRPVFLTAITAVLGLIPVVLGVSFDFGKMAFCMAEESKQFWQSMAIIIVFGLSIATILTLVVVPILYSFLETITVWTVMASKKIKELYWKPFEKYTLPPAA